MKVKCNKCSKIVDVKDNVCEKLGIDKTDFEKIFLCKECRKSKFIRKFEYNWCEISKMPGLPEWFIEKYKDKVDWSWISTCQKLSEEFIEKYADKVNWDQISTYQELSEQFIEKYADKVNWFSISGFQKLSPEFIVKHLNKITFYIYKNPYYETYPDSVKLLIKQKIKEVI